MRYRTAAAALLACLLFLALVTCLAADAAYGRPRPLPERDWTRTPAEARATSRVVEIGVTTCIHDQAKLDTGVACLWMTDPVPLIGGHQHLGWDFLDEIPVQTRVRIVGSSAAGTYRVTGHRSLGGGSHEIPGWMYSGEADLVLQTCNGDTTLGFSLLERI